VGTAVMSVLPVRSSVLRVNNVAASSGSSVKLFLQQTEEEKSACIS
jgi:hypothetical protein